MPMTRQEPEILSIAKNVYEDAYVAQDAIKIYEAIGFNADDVNRTKFKMFFVFTQQVMLKFVVIQIYKIYDQSNKSYKKHTVFEIVEYLKRHRQVAKYEMIYNQYPNTALKRSVFKKACTSDLSNIEDFLRNAEEITNEIVKSKDFKKLQTFRDKHIAHAEQVDPLNQIKEIPSIDQLNKFIDIAMDLSILIHNLFSQNECLDHPGGGMKTATENLINKIVGQFSQ